MGKYQSGVKREEPRYEGPPPIWRGIGCLLIVLVPLMSYAAAELAMPFMQERGLLLCQGRCQRRGHDGAAEIRVRSHEVQRRDGLTVEATQEEEGFSKPLRRLEQRRGLR